MATYWSMKHERKIDSQWFDYTGSSTWNGWSSYTSRVLTCKRLDDICYVLFYVHGTANSTDTRFTVPYMISSNGPHLQVLTRVYNSSSWVTGLLEGPVGGYTCNLYYTVNGTALSSTGDKRVFGQFFYFCQP